MPYNPSTGVYSLPAIYLAIPGTVIIAVQHNTPLEDLATANNYARPIIAGGTGANNSTSATQNIRAVSYDAQSFIASEKAMARRNIIAPYEAKNANYTAVADDVGSTLRFTAAATLSLAAAATLPNGWTANVIADGGAVTIDPDGSETINGLSTLIIPDGASCIIICDGSNFFTVIKPAVWEPIGANGGVYVLSAAASLDITGLSAFKKLRISGSLAPSIASAIGLLTSTNNGSSYDTGASDYNYQYLTAQNATVAGAAANSTAIQLSATASVNTTASEALNFTINVENFNKAIFANFDIRANAVNASGAFVTSVGARRLQLTARNAFRIIAASGTLTGSVTVEGQRG